MNTCRLDLWGFDVEAALRANRTLRVSAGTWELEDSFQLVTLNGNCFYGHQVGLDVSSMIFCPPRVNPGSQSDVTFYLEHFSMLPPRPALSRLLARNVAAPSIYVITGLVPLIPLRKASPS